MGLSKVRKLLREGNCDAVFNPLKDEPGRPAWKLPQRQGTKSGHRSHAELLHHQICPLGLSLSQSPDRSKLTKMSWMDQMQPQRYRSWQSWAETGKEEALPWPVIFQERSFGTISRGRQWWILIPLSTNTPVLALGSHPSLWSERLLPFLFVYFPS